MRKFTLFPTWLFLGFFLFTAHISLLSQNTPCAAVNLPNNMTEFQTYTTVGMTNSGVPHPGCGGSLTVDVWFSVVAPPTGRMNIAVLPGTITNAAMAFYQGPCNNLSFIDCTSDNNCGNPLMPGFDFYTLTPGVTYFIRIWPEGAGGTFQIRVSDGTLGPVPLPFNEVGTAQYTSPYCLRLTTATPAQAGCGWDPTPINFTQPFTRELLFNFGTLDPNGADGICMVFQNGPNPLNACGTGGGGIAAQGLPNSFIIEFDTWDNGAGVGDIPQDHVAINVNGIMTAPIAGPISLPPTGNVEDGQDHLVSFTWTPGSNTYVVRFNGIIVLTGTYNIIANCFAGNPNAYFGVTASTGGAFNVQTVCSPSPPLYPAGSRDTIFAEICQGDTYFAGGTFQSNTGVYFDNYPAFNGCDSTIVTYLTVYPDSYFAFSSFVCQGGSVTVGNSTYNTQGVHTTNLTNWRGCDSVVVLNLTVLNPQAVIQSSGNITCSNPNVVLNGTGSTPGPGMTFNWTGPSPACIIGGANLAVIQAACPGTYTLTITHQVGNVVCTSTTSVTVTLDVENILINIATPEELTCATECTTLNASGSTSGPGYSYAWTGPQNFNSNLLNPQVCNPGEYFLTIVNPLNGCQATGSVTVVENAEYPVADAGVDAELNCLLPSLTLDGGNSTGGNNPSFQWSEESGTPLGSDPQLEVSTPGTYILTVLNPDNNCSDSDTVLITQNLSQPLADAGPDQNLDCNASTATLDGSASSSGPQIALQWQTSGGAPLGTDPIQIVSDPGGYQLIVTHTGSGCADTAYVNVVQDLDAPVANPGPDQTITCSSPDVTLDGSGSSQGPEFSYEWQDESGASLGTEQSIQVGLPGLYYLLVASSANNCVDTASVLVSIDTLPPLADAGPDAELTCSDPVATIGDPNAIPVAGWTYTWLDEYNVPLGSETTQSVNQPGVYYLLVADQNNGCESLDSVLVVTDDDLPVADAGPPGTLNCDVSSINLGGPNTTSGPDILYSWTDVGGVEISTDPLTSTQTPGVYTLTVINTDNGCQSSDQVNVAIDTLAPVADAGPDQILNCFSPSLNLDGSASSQGAAFSYEWTENGTTLGTNPILNISTGGTYTLTVVNTQNGCIQSDEVLVDEDFAVPVADAGGDLIIDCGTNSVVLDGGGSSAGPEFSYAWLLNGQVAGTDVALQVSEAGLYTLEVLNTQNGCLATDDALVSLDANTPTADAGPDLTINCDQPTGTLDGSASTQGPGIVYEWIFNGNVVGSSLTLPVSEAGAYTLVATNTQNGCTSSAMATVIADFAEPSADAGADQTLNCYNPAIALDGSASSQGLEFSYEWTENGLTLGADPSLNISTGGTYTLTVLNTQNGCSQSDAVVVVEDFAAPLADAGTDLTITCSASSVVLDGGGSSLGAEFAFSWLLNGQAVGANTALQVSEAGLYTLEVLNTQNGCISTDEALVSLDAVAPVADAGPDLTINCTQPGGTLDGSASSQGPGIVYEWLLNGVPVGTTLTLPVSEAGIYTLVATNTQNGCASSAAAVVTADFAEPTANAGPDLTLNCYNPTGSLSGAGSSTGTQFLYAWTLGGAPAGGNIDLPVSAAGLYSLTVSNTQNGCSASDQALVSEDFQTPVANAGADLALTCSQATGTLSGAGSSTGPGITYEWLLGGATLGTNPSLPVSAPGNYTLLVTNTINGCSASDQAQVSANQNYPQAALNAGGILTCIVAQVDLIAAGTSSGPEFSYTWTALSGGPIQAGAGPLDASVAAPGTYQLIVLNTQNGCADTATAQVLQNITPPVADAGTGGQLNCLQTSLSLNGGGSQPSGQLSFLWTTTNGVLGGNVQSATPQALAAGTYNLLVTNLQNGCTATSQVVVTSTALSNLEVSFTLPDCHGDPVSISIDNLQGGKPPYQYSIDGGAIFSGQTLFVGLPAGGYNIVAQDADGCTMEQSLFIPEPPAVTLTVTPQVTLTLGDSYQLSALTNIPPNELASIVWSPPAGLSCDDCLKPVVSALQNALYTVTVTNLNGCSAQAGVQVLVEKPELFIPNMFSPNFDGINDRFTIYSAPGALQEIRQMRIFSRWGEHIFEANSIQPNDELAGWDGTCRGRIVDVGVYVWMAEIVWADGSVEWIKGDVTAVR